MQIRAAELDDLEQCAQLDMNYTTEYVWQMQSRESDRAISLRFDKVRLPRPMPVEYPRPTKQLSPQWHPENCFLLAHNVEGELVGFIEGKLQPWERRLWIRNLIIDRFYRQQGVGTRLLNAAIQWSLNCQLHQLMFEMQTKNYPAISFVQKHGFQYCGYNELYYPNGDIALFFARSI